MPDCSHGSFPYLRCMKWSRLLLFGLLSLLLIQCSEDFQLTEPYKDIPVVYGLIKRTDTAQYIRLEKAFLDENIPANQISKIADSLYYPNATIKLVQTATNTAHLLSRVDASLEGYPREAGPFATLPNYMYKIRTNVLNLKGGEELQLVIDRGDGSKQVSSKIILVSDLSYVFPDDGTRQLFFAYRSSYDFKWKNKNNTTVFDLKALVYIDEFDVVTQKSATKIIEIPFTKSQPGKIDRIDNISSAKVNGSAFYIFLHDKLLVNSNVERTINKIDFILTGGGPEIQGYLSILNANTGITASQEIPRYTNLSEGFGVFSSTVSIKKTITLEPPTLDSLQANSLTRDLNFK